jgi:hypothetical protein
LSLLTLTPIDDLFLPICRLIHLFPLLVGRGDIFRDVGRRD